MTESASARAIVEEWYRRAHEAETALGIERAEIAKIRASLATEKERAERAEEAIEEDKRRLVVQKERREAAEARCAEMERERDEEAAAVRHWRAASANRDKTIALVEEARDRYAADAERLREALREAIAIAEAAIAEFRALAALPAKPEGGGA